MENAFKISSGKQTGSAAVFEKASRLNHSCVLCAERMVIEGPDGVPMLTLVAARDIAEGQEIIVQYVSPVVTTAQRQRSIWRRWKFTCNCTLCRRPGHEIQMSDERRTKIQPWQKVLLGAKLDRTTLNAEAAVQAWEFIEECENEEEMSEHFLALRYACVVKAKGCKLTSFDSCYIAAFSAGRLSEFSVLKRCVERLLEFMDGPHGVPPPQQDWIRRTYKWLLDKGI